MSKSITYALIISDDEEFSKKLRQELRTNEISKDWRSLVITNSEGNREKDLPINKIFELILKIKQVHIVLFFDFERKEDFCFDLLKILNKYEGAQRVIQYCFFSEGHSKKMLENALHSGAHIVDYKRPDFSDIVLNIELLKNPSFDHVPVYATSEGYENVYWPKFFGKINYINEINVNIDTTFDKVDPSEEWINRFLPNLTGAPMAVTNSSSLEKKFRWIEDINTLRFEYSKANLVSGDFLNVKSVHDIDSQAGEYMYETSKRISPDLIESEAKKTKASFRELEDNRVRVLAFDKKLTLLQRNHEAFKLPYNLFSYPYLSLNNQDYQDISPHIIAVDWEQFCILDEDANILKLSEEKKLEALRDFYSEVSSEETVLIIFGVDQTNFRKITKRQLNVPFDITNDFLDDIVDIFTVKVKSKPYSLNNVIELKDFYVIDIDSNIKLELPIIIEKLNEHRIEFSSPMTIAHNTIIKLDYPCQCYVLVQDKLSTDKTYGGILIGLNEVEKKLIRQEVHRLMRIPRQAEIDHEKIEFFNLNNIEFIKRQKEKLKKSRDVVTRLKAEAE